MKTKLLSEKLAFLKKCVVLFMNLSHAAVTGVAGSEGVSERHVAAVQPVRAGQKGAARMEVVPAGHTTSLMAFMLLSFSSVLWTTYSFAFRTTKLKSFV